MIVSDNREEAAIKVPSRMLVIAVFVGALATSGLAPVSSVGIHELSLKRASSVGDKIEQDVDREDASVSTLYDVDREASEEQGDIGDTIEQDLSASDVARILH